MSPLYAPPLVYSPLQFRSGMYCTLFPTNSLTAVLMAYSALRVNALWIPEPVTFTRIGAEVTVVGSGGGETSTLNLCIYADGGVGNHGPAGLLFDASASGSASTILGNGLISGGSATVQEVTVSWQLAAGLYWAGGVVQGTGTQPTIRTLSVAGFQAWTAASIPAAGLLSAGFTQAGVSGALPNPMVPVTTSQTGPRMFAKVA